MSAKQINDGIALCSLNGSPAFIHRPVGHRLPLVTTFDLDHQMAVGVGTIQRVLENGGGFVTREVRRFASV